VQEELVSVDWHHQRGVIYRLLRQSEEAPKVKRSEIVYDQWRIVSDY